VRISRRRVVAALAGLLLLASLTLAAVSYVRWKAAGVAHPVTPPAGAAAPWPDGAGFDQDVSVRSGLVASRLRNDRGPGTVRIYAMPPGSPWLRARQTVATQLDHWEQLGDCADRPDATLVECAWREPTRWWPREVTLTMVRLRPGDDDTRRTFLIICSGVGA
jgi:hypothetical protein